jgi:tRNA (guanine26-N2/guanine27-N2)-dimethyltransferase
MITEGKIKLDIKVEDIVSKKMETFYNPVMKFNRDISVLLLNCLDNKSMQIGLPLAGSGVRGIRFIKELNKGIIKSIKMNDRSDGAIKSMKKNLSLNKIKSKKVFIFNNDANLFLLENMGFNYIDLDPFGSPNFVLNSSIIGLARESILAVTATDTAALTGTYKSACMRKYWAKPLYNDKMHEVGLRILIRKIQLIGAQFEKALVPIFSYSKDHYFRVFFICHKGKLKVDPIIKQHGMFMDAGPMWLGPLWDPKLALKMYKENTIEDNNDFLLEIKNESKIDVVGIYDIPRLAKIYKIPKLPKQDDLIKNIKKKGFLACPTHIRENSIKTNMSEKELVKIIKSC